MTLRWWRHLQDGTGTHGGQQPDGFTHPCHNDRGEPFCTTHHFPATTTTTAAAAANRILLFQQFGLQRLLRDHLRHDCRPVFAGDCPGGDGCRLSGPTERRRRRRCEPNSETAAQAAVDQGLLCRKANLLGLTIAERRRILPELFARTTVEYKEEEDAEETEEDDKTTKDHHPPPESNNDNIGRRDNDGDVELCKIPTPLPENSSEDNNNDDDDDEEQQSQSQDSSRPVCSICLVPYCTGDSVMTGTQCTNHQFHAHCGRAWLLRHDHCPYCRGAMMRPAELREAAVRVLGAARVEELGRTSQNIPNLNPDPNPTTTQPPQRDDNDPVETAAAAGAANTEIMTEAGDEDSIPVVEGISAAEHRADASGAEGGGDVVVVVVVEEDDHEDSADTRSISVQ